MDLSFKVKIIYLTVKKKSSDLAIFLIVLPQNKM